MAEWLTTWEAAKRTGRSTRTIWHWLAAGMPHRKDYSQRPGGLVLIELETLLAWYRRKTVANPVHKFRVRAVVRGDSSSRVVDGRELLTIAEAARRVSRTPSTLQCWRAEGMPVDVDEFGGVWVALEDAQAWRDRKLLTMRGPRAWERDELQAA